MTEYHKLTVCDILDTTIVLEWLSEWHSRSKCTRWFFIFIQLEFHSICIHEERTMIDATMTNKVVFGDETHLGLPT